MTNSSQLALAGQKVAPHDAALNGDLRKRALTYAARGWPVHPLLPGAKKPLTEHGFKDASTDPTQITAWWTQWPDANIGVATGAVSGIFVVDVDPRNGGDESLAHLVEEHGELPSTLTQKTGGGGLHFLFEYVSGIANSSTTLGSGLDIKRDGGYIVVAPSLHPSGGVYAWKDPDAEVAPAPDWLIAKIKTPAPPKAVAAPVSDEIQEGERDTTLTSLAGSMRRRSMSRVAIEQALLAENRSRCAPPLPDAEVKRIAKSVSRYAPGVVAELTDAGNADRLAARYGHRLKFVPASKQWLAWDGTRWRRDDRCVATARAIETARSIREEELAVLDANDERRKALAKWARSSASRRAIEAMLALAQPKLAITPDELDRDPWLLNVKNGTLDLRDGSFRDHDPDDMITKVADVTYDPDADAPIFQAFLDRVSDGVAKAAYLQRVYGYALTGDAGERCFFLLTGPGDNGKTTLNGAMAGLLGDYASNASAESFLSSRYGKVPNDIARLKGIRLVTASEIDRQGALADAVLKELTGGDSVTARFFFAEFFDFVPQFKLVISCNHLPKVSGDDQAMWNRIRVVQLGESIPKPEQDMHLGEKLTQERSGILNWALKGLAQWRDGGLQEPDCVKQQVATYRSANDDIGGFLADSCETAAEAEVPPGQLNARCGEAFEAYSKWCRANGFEPRTSNAFGRAMTTAGFERKHLGSGSTRRRVYVDLRLIEE